MKTLEFNHNVEGSISIRVDDKTVGSIHETKQGATAIIVYEGNSQEVSYESLEQARLDLCTYFANLDVYEF